VYRNHWFWRGAKANSRATGGAYAIFSRFRAIKLTKWVAGGGYFPVSVLVLPGLARSHCVKPAVSFCQVEPNPDFGIYNPDPEVISPRVPDPEDRARWLTLHSAIHMNLIGKEHYMALTKDQLIADIAEAIDAPKTTARNALDQLGQIVADQLENGGEITLPGIGKLKVTERPARTGRNPSTGAAIEIAAKKVIKLVVAKGLTDAVNK
jgi:DNA-binding protein HU-beta